MDVYTRVYAVQCKTPGYFYVGSTSRPPYLRESEHREGWGAHWTTKHGFKRMLFAQLVEPGTSARLEDDLTLALMYRYGWGACRGGDRTAQKESVLRQYLPECLQALGPRDVLPLHLRPVSQLPAELRALVDRFEVFCGLEDAN